MKRLYSRYIWRITTKLWWKTKLTTKCYKQTNYETKCLYPKTQKSLANLPLKFLNDFKYLKYIVKIDNCHESLRLSYQVGVTKTNLPRINKLYWSQFLYDHCEM